MVRNLLWVAHIDGRHQDESGILLSAFQGDSLDSVKGLDGPFKVDFLCSFFATFAPGSSSEVDHVGLGFDELFGEFQGGVVLQGEDDRCGSCVLDILGLGFVADY